jgi:hypothetical protein
VKYLDATLDLPDDLLHPMAAFARHEDVVRYEELVAWTVRPDRGLEYALFYVEADPEPYERALREVETVREYELTPIDDGSLHVWVCEETLPAVQAWRDAFVDRNLVVVPPVRFDADARMRMTVVGQGADVQQLVADIPDAVDLTVEEIGTYDRRGGSLAGDLTDRQLAAVQTALDLGYYAVPREADLAEVADALDCAESSASVLLRRAERTVLSAVLDRYGRTTGTPGARSEPDV